MYDRIVIPLDGSHLAERALPPAEELARLTGAALHLVRAVDATQLSLQGYGVYPMALQGGAPELLAEEERAARNYLDRMAARLTKRGLSAATDLLEGFAPREIVGMTRAGDLIVMATHGRGGMARWFLGSVAEDVIRRASVPVLLIRAPSTAAPGEHSRPEPASAAVKAVAAADRASS